MNCPQCGSGDVQRVDGKNFVRQVWSALGGWPYVCQDCTVSFYSTYRYPPRSSAAMLTHLNEAILARGEDKVSVTQAQIEVQ